jgi:type IV pilus assembly protein PilE
VSGNRHPRASRGFTVLEVLVALGIVAVLAAVVAPNYSDHVSRSRVLEAIAKLSDYRARMEQFFLDRRAYVDEFGSCGVPPPVPAPTADAFVIACSATATSYVYTATGIAAKGMSGFEYTIDETGTRGTLSVPRGWARSADCWTFRRDGSCV